MSIIVGIDLGTTNSAIGVTQNGTQQLIPNLVGSVLTPSVVGVDDSDSILVGHAAREWNVLHPEKCAVNFKRQMGSDWTCLLGRHTLSATELSSLVLGSLKRDAEAVLKTKVDRAVITVPAYFNNQQRNATVDAGKLAGLRVERIINEPTAAALSYGLHETDADKTVAVFDLGGGTFDISIVDFFEGAVEVRASAGEAILGGEDFTKALAREILASRSVMFEHAELKMPAMVSRMIQQCENAKRVLTEQAVAEVTIPDKNGSLTQDCERFEIDRELLARACAPLLERIGIPVRRAMGDAGLNRHDLDQVILVGGATRMPLIHSVAVDLLGTPSCDKNPDIVVAMGAAIQAGLLAEDRALEDMVVVDVAPFSMGVEISKRMDTERKDGYFSPIINRNTVIPTSRTHSFCTTTHNQESVELNIYQGESRMVKDNLLLGTVTVHGIPRGPEGQVIDVRFTYDLNGLLEVETTVNKTGEKKNLVISNNVTNLSKEEVAKALAAMESLKVHPRSKTKNHFILKRSERLFQELPVVLRNELSMHMDLFEAALETQDPNRINLVRQQLEAFLNTYDRPVDD